MPPKLGPTGEYKRGKLNSDDIGGLNVKLSVGPGRRLTLEFGTGLEWLAHHAADARVTAAVFRRQVFQQWGPLDYVVGELPIGVHIDRDAIISTLPTPCEALAANPEVFLAWAQRLDEAADLLDPPTASPAGS